MAKIIMKTPLVEMDGDEMTRILWQWIKDILINRAVGVGNTAYEYHTLLTAVLIVHRVVIVLSKERYFGHVFTRKVKGYKVVVTVIAVKR